MKYRIIQNTNGRYEVQSKGWFFWRSYGKYEPMFIIKQLDTFIEAEGYLQEIITENSKKQKKIKVVKEIEV